MHRIRITLSIALCGLAGAFFVSSVAPIARGTGAGSATSNVPPKITTADTDVAAEDPDLPSWMAGRVDKNDYLQRRGEYIEMRRGLGHGLSYDARAQAVEQMNQQQQAQQRSVDGGGPTWVNIGPNPIPNGQTSDTSVPVSGRTPAIAVHPTDPMTVFAGTAQGGLYRSTNGGDAWTPIAEFQLETLAIGAITFDPLDPTTVYVGTGEAGFCGSGCFAGRGMYIIRNALSATPTVSGPFRTDGGGADVLSGRATGKIIVPQGQNNILFISTTQAIGGNTPVRPKEAPPRGIYRSNNAQSATPTFEKVTITGAGADRAVVDLAIDPGDPNIMLANVIGESGDGGIYRTTDALSATPTWTRTRTLPDLQTQGRAEFSFIRKTGDNTPIVYAAVAQIPTIALGYTANCGSSSAGYVIKSTDGGATWSNPLPGSGGFCGGQCSYDIAIAARPDDTAVHLGGSARGGSGQCLTDVMKRSVNGGNFVRNDSTLHADEHALTIAPSNPDVVYTGNDGGVWRSDNNGNNWVSKNNSTISATQFQDLALHPFDRHFMLGGTQDNGTNCLLNNGTQWTNCRGGDGGHALIDTNAFDTTNVTMYHTFFNVPGSQILFERADNTGFAWTFRGCIGAGPSNNGIGCTDTTLFYAPMTQGPGNPNTIYFATDRLYRSENRGDTMPAVSQVLEAGQPITAIGVSRQDDNVRIAGIRNGRVFATTTGSNPMVEVTGANFPPSNPNETLPGRKPIGEAMIDPNNKNTAYITFGSYALPLGQHIFKTTNLNSATPNWTPSSNGIPDVPVDSMAIDPADSNQLFAGTDIGVFRSTDGGANWAPFGTGLPRVAVFDMEINAVHRILRIATHGRSIYEIAIGGVGLGVIRTNTVTLASEGCSPGNSSVDPNETVTVSFSAKNIGGGPTNPNSTITLRSTGGVVNPSGPQNFGNIPAGGTGAQNFTFTASGACGGTINLTFEVNDGTNTFTLPAIPFELGQFVTSSPSYTENFDGVTPPALPPGWTTVATGAGTPWTTTTAFSDSAPNSAANPGTTVPGETTLTSPTVAIPSAPNNGTNPGVQMSFRNDYNTEGGFDGTVLEISVNGGAFQDIIAAGGTFATGGYNSSIGVTDSPLTGRAAWTGTSNGFITTTVNLPSAAFGQNAQFRWRSAYDTGSNPANGGQRIDTISIFAATRVCCLSAPAPSTAVSRKNHGGTNFDVDLLAGSRIEPRRAGAGGTHQLIVTFPQPVTVGGVTVSSKDNAATGSAVANGSTVTVNLANVADDQTLVITLTNVSDQMVVGNVPLQMAVLLGDTNADRTVNSGDVTQTKNRSGFAPAAGTFRSDVNADGTINSGDITVVKGNSGKSLDDGQ